MSAGASNTTKRNDPCPCGSGAKYKKCCLPKHMEEQVLQARMESFFDQKFKLNQDMHLFLADKQGGLKILEYEKSKHFDASLGPSRNGAGNKWTYFCRIYDNGLRGIEWFVEEMGNRYPWEMRKMLERWKEMKFSCYQVVDHYEQGMIIADIWSQERYRMPYCETMIKLPPWSVAVGMIEPFMEDWCVHGAFMWGHPDTETEIMIRVQQLQAESAKASEREMSPADILAAHYPEFMKGSVEISNRTTHDSVEDITNLSRLMEWYRSLQEKQPEASAEDLVRRMEFEQNRADAGVTHLNLLREELGLAESPFAGL